MTNLVILESLVLNFSLLCMISILLVNKECLHPFISDLNAYEKFFGATYSLILKNILMISINASNIHSMAYVSPMQNLFSCNIHRSENISKI